MNVSPSALDQLNDVIINWTMLDSPTIKPVISHLTGPNWLVTLTEVWPDSDGSIGNGSTTLDMHVDWAVDELAKWDCRRLSWDSWSFKSKREAQKFITLFTLRWAQ